MSTIQEQKRVRSRRNIDQNGLFSRISEIESDVQSLGTGLASVNTSLGDFKSYFELQMREIKTTLGGLSNEFSQRSKTNWGVLGTWAGALLAFIIFYNDLSLKPFDFRIDRAESELTFNREQRYKRIYDQGGRAERIRQIEQHLTGLEKTLYRELDFIRETISKRASDRWTREDHESYARLVNQRVSIIEQILRNKKSE